MNLTFNDIKNIHKKIRHNVKWTETTFTSSISEKLGIGTFLKLENRQHTGAFKIRGSYSKLLSLSAAEKKAGVVAMSAGNHAQAVAYFANKFNVSSTIIMPEQAPFSKVSRTKELGANVILKGRTLNETSDFVNNLAKEKNLKLIHPYDDYDVISGQGSIGIEIFEKINELDCIVVPIGGGGLISGISIVAKKINPKIKIFGVESDLYPSTYN